MKINRRYYLLLTLFTALILLSSNVSYSESLPTAYSKGSILDAGKLVLDAPAGKYGFLKPDGSRFVFDNGKELKMWGTNLYLHGNLQTPQSATKLANQLAKLGYNMVRLHGLDNVKGGILAEGDTLQLNELAIDRLDYLISELSRGIDVDLNIHVNNRYIYKDMQDPTSIPINGKQVHYFNKQAEQHLKDYIDLLANHVNPYTDLAYKDEPAIALVELINEDGMLQAFLGGQLNGKYTSNPEKNVNGVYEDQLNKQWNEWLKKKYISASKFASAWKGKKAGNNLLKNPTFSNNISNWFFKVNSKDIKAAITYDNQEKAVKVINSQLSTSSAEWQVQFGQLGLAIENGKRYELSFDVKSSQNKSISLELGNIKPINGSYGAYLDNTTSKAFKAVPVTTKWTNQHFFFVSSDTTQNGNTKFDFALGKMKGDIMLKHIVLRESEIIGLSPDESLEKANIKRLFIFSSDEYSKERLWDTTDFYYQLEDGLNQRLYQFAKSEGFKQPLTFNNWYNGGNLSTYAQSKGDYTDEHIYWDHPSSWNLTNFTMHNKSPISDPDKVLPHMMMIQGIKNKPYVLSEVNNTFPAKYEYEFFPTLVPYSSFQSVNGIMHFAYTEKDLKDITSDKISSFMYTINDPVANIQSFIYSIVYLKNYIQPAKQRVVLNYTKTYALQTLKQYQDKFHYNLPGASWKDGTDLPLSVFATHGVQRISLRTNQ